MKKLKQIFASFRSTEDFNDISPDGKIAEVEIAFASDGEIEKFKKALKKNNVQVEILYESPKLGQWFKPGDEGKYNHMPFLDLGIKKQNWDSFIEFYRDYIFENNYITAPRINL